MRALSLLVFSTVYLYFGLGSNLWAAQNKSLGLQTSTADSTENISDLDLQSSNTSNNGGFCYEIAAGNNKIGFVLEIKSFDEKKGHHENKLYTYIKTKNSSLEEQLSTTSDPFFSPISFEYKLTTNQKLAKEISGKFKKLPKDYVVEYKIQTHNNKPSTKKVSVPKGTVFLSRLTDLIFTKKGIEDIDPNNEMIVSSFDEKTGELKTTKTHLDKNTDGIKLIHEINSRVFNTEHTYRGHLLKSTDPKQNITLSKCSTIDSHIKTAEDQRIYKNFFAKKEQEILKSCCQL